MSRTGAGSDLITLGDPTRARILRLIRDSESGRALVGGLAEALGLRQPTVSHHMKALHDEGIVVREPDGRRVWYSIAPRHEDRVSALLGDDAIARAPDLERITRDLVDRFAGVLAPDVVETGVRESYALLAAQDPPPRLIASRTASFAQGRLDAASRATSAVPSVLFVCVQNAGRSQLAAGILRRLAGDRVIVRTAGSAPAVEVRRSIVAALDEIGVPLGDEFPKPLTDDAVRAADVVVTMGCGDVCAVYPGTRYLDWPVDDPVGRPMDEVRVIRDSIEQRVRALVDDLLSESSSAVRD